MPAPFFSVVTPDVPQFSVRPYQLKLKQAGVNFSGDVFFRKSQDHILIFYKDGRVLTSTVNSSVAVQDKLQLLPAYTKILLETEV